MDNMDDMEKGMTVVIALTIVVVLVFCLPLFMGWFK